MNDNRRTGTKAITIVYSYSHSSMCYTYVSMFLCGVVLISYF